MLYKRGNGAEMRRGREGETGRDREKLISQRSQSLPGKIKLLRLSCDPVCVSFHQSLTFFLICFGGWLKPGLTLIFVFYQTTTKTQQLILHAWIFLVTRILSNDNQELLFVPWVMFGGAGRKAGGSHRETG